MRDFQAFATLTAVSVEQLENAIRQLAVAERHRLLEWIDIHRDELLGTPASPAVESAQEREVLLRLRESDSDPSTLQPFDESDVTRMFEEFGNARPKKAPPR